MLCISGSGISAWSAHLPFPNRSRRCFSRWMRRLFPNHLHLIGDIMERLPRLLGIPARSCEMSITSFRALSWASPLPGFSDGHAE
jgi:hypothetical protein